MKNLIYIAILFLVMSCNGNKKETSNHEETQLNKEELLGNFDWLLGKWKRLDEEQGKETFENWIKNSDIEYSGIGFTMQNNDTIKQEIIKLKKEGHSWNLMVKTPDEAESTIFKMTLYNSKEFICENNEIEFPNKIRYWQTGKNMHASVSNSEINIPFEFEKLIE